MQAALGGGGAVANTADLGRATSDELLRQAQGESRDRAKIEKAGHDFESILLGSWLQGAEESFAAAPGGAADDEDEDGSRSQFLSMSMQQLASTLVNAGGLGISKMIIDHLAAAEPKDGTPKKVAKQG